MQTLRSKLNFKFLHVSCKYAIKIPLLLYLLGIFVIPGQPSYTGVNQVALGTGENEVTLGTDNGTVGYQMMLGTTK